MAPWSLYSGHLWTSRHVEVHGLTPTGNGPHFGPILPHGAMIYGLPKDFFFFGVLSFEFDQSFGCWTAIPVYVYCSYVLRTYRSIASFSPGVDVTAMVVVDADATRHLIP